MDRNQYCFIKLNDANYLILLFKKEKKKMDVYHNIHITYIKQMKNLNCL